MCAGAIFWSNIGRVVFGIDAERLRVFRGERRTSAMPSCPAATCSAPRRIRSNASGRR